jgi:hypothetical protein
MLLVLRYAQKIHFPVFLITFILFYYQKIVIHYNKQGAKSVLGYYQNDLTQALLRIYPQIGLEESKFSTSKFSIAFFFFPYPPFVHNREATLGIYSRKKIFF